jgi:hypothetical protein
MGNCFRYVFRKSSVQRRDCERAAFRLGKTDSNRPGTELRRSVIFHLRCLCRTRLTLPAAANKIPAKRAGELEM